MKIPPKFLREIVILSLCFFTSLLVVFKGVLPLMAQWNQIRTEHQSLEKKVVSLKSQIKDREILKTLNTSLLQELNEIGGRIENYHLNQDYVREISSGIEHHALELQQFKVTQDQDEIIVNVNVEGAFHRIIAFCYDIETNAIPQKIKNLQLKMRRKKLQAHLTLIIPIRGGDHEVTP